MFTNYMFTLLYMCNDYVSLTCKLPGEIRQHVAMLFAVRVRHARWRRVAVGVDEEMEEELRVAEELLLAGVDGTAQLVALAQQRRERRLLEVPATRRHDRWLTARVSYKIDQCSRTATKPHVNGEIRLKIHDCINLRYGVHQIHDLSNSLLIILLTLLMRIK